MKSLLLAMVMMTIGFGSAQAQYVITHAKATMSSQQRGLYYSLPRTVFQIDFVVEETQLLEGPYSNYVNYVGAEDYIVEDAVEYRIKDVKLNVQAEADPNATFFVAMTGKKGNGTSFCLSPQGILQGVGIDCPPYMAEPKQTYTPQSGSEPAGFKYQYGNSAVLGEEQMARSAADMVKKVRDEKLKLITGFQETAFNYDTYRQMYADLDAMENDYLSLFVGKRISKTYVKTVYVTPNKEVATQSIAKFSPESGLTIGVSGEGELITIQTISLQATGTMNAPSQSAVESLSLEDKLFYRIPEIANVKVTMGSEVLLESRETIAQLGVFMLAPLGNTKLALDPMTGQIINIAME
ncbi:MAG: DUF4831 family protein [Bacteroidales bacterium]|nr:DUF4831 family protein [Bacteroidales bacterium]